MIRIIPISMFPLLSLVPNTFLYPWLMAMLTRGLNMKSRNMTEFGDVRLRNRLRYAASGTSFHSLPSVIPYYRSCSKYFLESWFDEYDRQMAHPWCRDSPISQLTSATYSSARWEYSVKLVALFRIYFFPQTRCTKTEGPNSFPSTIRCLEAVTAPRNGLAGDDLI